MVRTIILIVALLIAVIVGMCSAGEKEELIQQAQFFDNFKKQSMSNYDYATVQLDRVLKSLNTIAEKEKSDVKKDVKKDAVGTK